MITRRAWIEGADMVELYIGLRKKCIRFHRDMSSSMRVAAAQANCDNTSIKEMKLQLPLRRRGI